jgi:hypothetical protein
MAVVAGVVAALTGASSFLGVAAATSVFGIATGTVGFAALQIGASLLFNSAIASLTNQSQQVDTVLNLAFPTSRPAKRHILGNVRANCTPMPSAVIGGKYYAVYLVQSRITSGDMQVYIDNQLLEWTGDPYDFSGDGGQVTSEPFGNVSDPDATHVNVFIGRGDQTSPPQMFLDEAGYDVSEDDADLRFKSTDAFQGNTMLFIRMRAGASETRRKRWKGGVPKVSVSGELTTIFDPRDETQSISDPSTWQYSDNQALVALDVLINNPFRPYREIHLDLASWSEAADVADQLVLVKGGGTIPRYRASGVVTFDGGEIEDIINPIINAGAGQLSRVGGLLGMVPAVWSEPTHTITESLDGLEFSNDSFKGEAPTEIRAEYTPETRPLESAETPIYTIAGALEANGGEVSTVSYDLGWVPDHRQAQRVAKILGLRQRQSTTLSLVGLPSDLVLAVGSNTNVALPEPFGEYMDGQYAVESIFAGLDPLGESGLALRSNISLRSTSQDVYAWDAELEEQDVFDPTFDATVDGVVTGGAIAVTTGNTVNDTTGQVVIPRALFEFDPSPTSSVFSYEYQFARQDDEYSLAFFIDGETRNLADKVFGYLSGEAGEEYKLRVRAVSSIGASDWVEFENITLVVDVTLTAPTPVSATGGAGEIAVTFTASNDVDLEFTEIWAGDTSVVGAAALIHVSYANQGDPVNHTETGLGSAQTRYYFGRTRGPFNSASTFSAAISATTDV